MAQPFYSDPFHAYFIAGGRTLEIVRRLEGEIHAPQAALDAIAREVGARKGYSHGGVSADEPIDHPALTFIEKTPAGYYYQASATPEGDALKARLRDIPSCPVQNDLALGRRLTGKETVDPNPDRLEPTYVQSRSGTRPMQGVVAAASFERINDTYVVIVPRTLHAVFGAEAEPPQHGDRFRPAEGYRYDWFTPPDSEQVPYSRVVAMREEAMGDQFAPRQVKMTIPAWKRR